MKFQRGDSGRSHFPSLSVFHILPDLRARPDPSGRSLPVMQSGKIMVGPSAKNIHKDAERKRDSQEIKGETETKYKITIRKAKLRHGGVMFRGQKHKWLQPF